MPNNEQELIDKVTALVKIKFGGDWLVAFMHYDKTNTGDITVGELIDMLADAGVGWRWTRKAWAEAVIDRLDSDNDHVISLSEFRAVFLPS